MKKIIAIITDRSGFQRVRLVNAKNFPEAFKKIQEDDEENGSHLNNARKIEMEIIDKELR